MNTKTLFPFILVLLFPFILKSQNVLQVSENRTIYIEKVIHAPDYSKSQLYNIAISWVSETFNSPKDVMSFNDSELGKIKGTFISDYKISLAQHPWSNTFTIQVKEGRLKLRIDNIRNIQYNYPLSTNILKRDNTLRNYSGLTDDVQSKLNRLIIDFEKYISNFSSSEENW